MLHKEFLSHLIRFSLHGRACEILKVEDHFASDIVFSTVGSLPDYVTDYTNSPKMNTVHATYISMMSGAASSN